MQTWLPVDSQSNAVPATRPRRGSRLARPSQTREPRVLQHRGVDSARPHGADYVTIPVAAAMTGYSAKAIRRKIEAGVWLEGREFRRAPDGHVLISVKGYELCVERGRA